MSEESISKNEFDWCTSDWVVVQLFHACCTSVVHRMYPALESGMGCTSRCTMMYINVCELPSVQFRCASCCASTSPRLPLMQLCCTSQVPDCFPRNTVVRPGCKMYIRLLRDCLPSNTVVHPSPLLHTSPACAQYCCTSECAAVHQGYINVAEIAVCSIALHVRVC